MSLLLRERCHTRGNGFSHSLGDLKLFILLQLDNSPDTILRGLSRTIWREKKLDKNFHTEPFRLIFSKPT